MPVLSFILLTITIGYFLYWLAEIPATWFSRIAEKSENNYEGMHLIKKNDFI